MLMTMIRGSRAVLLRPSVATFEAHEQRRLGWALLYVLIGATITAILGWLTFLIQRPFLERQAATVAAYFAGLEARLGRDLPYETLLRPWEPGIPVLGNLLHTMIGFLLYLVIVYLLGRLLGGDGKFGELAYDIALFWAPVAIVGAVVNLFSFGWFSCLTAPLAIFVTFYGLYLTYLGVQSGLNLPPRRALVVVLIPALFYLSLFCLLIAAFVALTGLQVSG
ncbi:MAG: YIP1 family protein [Chloroflexaceae bacterium]|nr:YIP1 family protein [Chloroflexaceae bacterium]